MLIESETRDPPVPLRWSLQVVGRLRMTDAAGAEIVLPGKLDPALLAYLALNQGRRHLRTKLATLLWAARADSLHSLSESLKNLRKALGDTDGRVIAHKIDPVVTDFRAMFVDAIRFEELAKQGSREALERAEALFGGELLEGFDIRSEDFEQWLASERHRLRGILVKVLSRLQHLRAQAGETDKAIETAQRLLRLDPLHEESYRSLMQLHASAGRRTLALQQFNILRTVLQKELQVEPEPETCRLAEEIRRSDKPPGPGPVRREVITSDPSDARPAETSLEPASFVAAVGAAAARDAPDPVPAPPAPHFIPEVMQHAGAVLQSAAAKDFPHPVPAPPAPYTIPERTSPKVPDEAPPHPRPLWRLGGSIRRWAAGGIVLLLLAGAIVLGSYVWRYWNVPWLAPNPVDNVIVWTKALLPGDAPPSIAVLPFASSGGDPAAQTLAHGLSGDITTALGRVSEIKEIKVIAAASVQSYDPNPLDLRAVASDLKVRYLLLGSARQSGDQLRVQVQLIDANEGRQVWGKSYPGQTSDVFVLQDQITFDVINEVYDVITASAMQRLTAIHGTRNLGAWLEANEGLKLLRHLTPEDNARARLLYNRAIALDPSYAGAYEGLAWTYLLDAEFGWISSITESLAEAQRLTEQALRLDPEKPQLYSLRGHLNLLLRNFNQAVADGERAVETERNDADAPALLAFTLTYTGEPERAIALMQRAIELNPRYPAWYGWALGRAVRLAGDPERAVETLEANLPERPASMIPLVELVIAYGEAGDSSMANAMAATIRQRVPHFSIGAWAALQPYEDPAMTERDAAALRTAGLPD